MAGSITDPAGDADPASGIHPYDIGTYGVVYDDAGSITVSISFSDPMDDKVDFTWRLTASVGVWSAAAGACDVTSPGSARLDVRGTDAPDPNFPNTHYSVVGFAGGSERAVRVDVAVVGDALVFGPIVDPDAFALRFYNCVADVRLRNFAGGSDDAPGPFCMSTRGTIPCGELSAPIAIRWSSPRDGQTVSGVLREGPGSCLAESAGPVVRTENWIDGALHDEQVSFPWGCEVDTRTLPDGPHTLTVKAFTADGRSAEDTIRIEVANGAAVAPPPSSPPATGVPAPAPAPAPATPSSPGVVTSPAGGDPGTGGAAEATTTGRRLTLARARTVGRRALAARFGRAFRDRTRYRATCRASGPRRVFCRVRWRYGQWLYRGTVVVRRTATRDAAVVRVTRRRVR
ncbi:MAG TPA: hypothetical protein VN213_05365 [Solirubrobacteraceae bacterium]|nr:hypothetical protein [Solirubrobacteraceae bacterium]